MGQGKHRPKRRLGRAFTPMETEVQKGLDGSSVAAASQPVEDEAARVSRYRKRTMDSQYLAKFDASRLEEANEAWWATCCRSMAKCLRQV